MSDVAAVPVGVSDSGVMSLRSGSIEIRDTAINVEDLMTRIRTNIEERKKSRHFREDVLLAQGVDFLPPGQSSKSGADRLALLVYAARLDLEGEPIASHRTFFGFAIKWAKRFARFWTRKYTDGVFSQQNHFNSEVIATLSELTKRLEQLEAENRELREQLDALSRR